jgi:hypothetical protein
VVSAETRSLVVRAKRIYAERLQSELEATQLNRFVAIEPDSGDDFLGDTLGEAMRSARIKHPARPSHVIRIGHPAALHMGVMEK